MRVHHLRQVAARSSARSLSASSAGGVVGGMGGDVDQGGFEPLGVGMAELEMAEFLEVVVQQPGVIERGLQDQRLAGRHRGAVAAMQRAAAICWLTTT